MRTSRTDTKATVLASRSAKTSSQRGSNSGFSSAQTTGSAPADGRTDETLATKRASAVRRFRDADKRLIENVRQLRSLLKQRSEGPLSRGGCPHSATLCPSYQPRKPTWKEY